MVHFRKIIEHPLQLGCCTRCWEFHSEEAKVPALIEITCLQGIGQQWTNKHIDHKILVGFSNLVAGSAIY